MLWEFFTDDLQNLSTGARLVRAPGGNLIHLCFLQLIEITSVYR
jgi:hypothetical protein